MGDRNPHQLPDWKATAYYNRKGQEAAIHTLTTHKYSEPKATQRPQETAQLHNHHSPERWGYNDPDHIPIFFHRLAI